MIKVENHKNLYRDEKSGAIINCDTYGYSQYKKMKALKNNERREIDKIKEDISEIKDLLKQLLKK